MEHTMNVLVICNFNMKFIYVYIGVPCRANDTNILTQCNKNKSFSLPSNGKYYLIDFGYPTIIGYLEPHTRIQYHFDQFHRGGLPTNMQELFNQKHVNL